MAGKRTRLAGAAALCAALLVFAAPLAAGCGKAKVAVPDLAGLDLQEAQAALRESGLEPGDVAEEFSDALPPGEVISSRPEPGAKLAGGSRVDLMVSRGPETVTVPALVGLDEAQAATALRELGFQVEVSRSYSEEVAAGCVCGVDPASGSSAAYGSKVTVTVSQGSAYVACSTCGGDGRIEQRVTCSNCGGDGYVQTTTACPECGGSGVCPT